ncbi:hypothetical protein GCM10027059_12280 [Myceligenerans halotolerans]
MTVAAAAPPSAKTPTKHIATIRGLRDQPLPEECRLAGRSVRWGIRCGGIDACCADGRSG